MMYCLIKLSFIAKHHKKIICVLKGKLETLICHAEAKPVLKCPLYALMMLRNKRKTTLDWLSLLNPNIIATILLLIIILVIALVLLISSSSSFIIIIFSSNSSLSSIVIT
jgi:hypothetical protein